MIGGTKLVELDRSAILFEEINENQGIYFALMFLLDSGYGRDEIQAIADRIKPESKNAKQQVIRGVNCFCPTSFACNND